MATLRVQPLVIRQGRTWAKLDEALHPSQQDTFSAHAATVAGGISIVPPP